MATGDSLSQALGEEALRLLNLTERVITARSIEELAERVLSGIAGMTESGSVLLYIVHPRLPVPHFAQQGFQAEAASEVESLCAERYDRVCGRPTGQRVSVPAVPGEKAAVELVLHPLRADEKCVGLIGLTADEGVARISPAVLTRLLRLFASAIVRLVEHIESRKRILYLNTYMMVSSMLAQSLDLSELLETSLYCCMEAVSAEAASVLLLDDEQKNFRFYQVEGPAKPVLAGATFPVGKGLAGSVLQAQQPEIINDVHSDSRFLEEVDTESGFRTRNMIAIPLVAGEEQVGVLEVLNKAEGRVFVEEDLLLLVSVAEEIAFAVRNAKVFEYVVNTYCLQRQGRMSCRGCKRPLGSWTPCVKYREAPIGT